MWFVFAIFTAAYACATIHGVSSQGSGSASGTIYPLMNPWVGLTPESTDTGRVTGPLTMYGYHEGKGACLFLNHTELIDSLPWGSHITRYVAMNPSHFLTYASCGMCVMFRSNISLSNGAISADWTYGIVVDATGNGTMLDIQYDYAAGQPGGQPGQWYAVECAVGDSPFSYALHGANPWWLNFQILNRRYPVHSVSMFQKCVGSNCNSPGRDIELTRTISDHWNGPTNYSSFSFPTNITITSIFGDVVHDVVDFAPGFSYANAQTVGSVQFPARGYTVAGAQFSQNAPVNINPVLPSGTPTAAIPTNPPSSQPSGAPGTATGTPTTPAGQTTRSPTPAPTGSGVSCHFMDALSYLMTSLLLLLCAAHAC